ncbi:MAG: TIGR01212 family radical SAM protein [Kiritimatiellae bacterium]|nr:TIGR01212 family radical SAM protein [Kiritimatiellia bacterium]
MNFKNPYLSYKEFMKKRYGEALYRVPVDLGHSCPNRGFDGGGGCAFCAEDGGRAMQISGAQTLTEQVEAAAGFARRRYGAYKFMLYIQAYTGTFTDPGCFQDQISELLEMQNFTALSIGTRPDCLPDEIVSFLQELNRDVDVWVELGVQSTHDSTLKLVNRGHDWKCSHDAIVRLAAVGIKSAVHLILGLPGEGISEWQLSAERIAALPVAAVKLHNLHVIAGSTLADVYAEKPFPLLNEHQYAEGVIGVVRRLPENIPLMRLTTDTPADRLIAPKWSMTKGEFTSYLIEQMGFQGVQQGDLFHKKTQVDQRNETAGFQPLSTDDGSVTFWSGAFKEHYHSKVGAVTESVSKFVEPAQLRERLKKGDVRLLDICFGLGYNTLSACEEAHSIKEGTLCVKAMEIDINVVRAAADSINPYAGSSLDWRAIASALVAEKRWTGEFGSIGFLHGDARDKLAEAATEGLFDVVFLDAFSTQRNAELWTLDFFRRVRAVMSESGVLLTYCAALPVRSGLMQAGFFVGETAAVGRRRGGTIAAIRAEDIHLPIVSEELELIKDTKRGIPYRDPEQVWSNRRILKEREAQRNNVV